MQGFRGLVERWGGRGRCGGASELLGGARDGRRQWRRRTAATVSFGRERESEGEPGGRVRGCRRGRGDDQKTIHAAQRRPGRCREAGWCVASSGAPCSPPCLLWQGEAAGWHGPAQCWAGWAGQVGPGKSTPFIYFFCFGLNKIPRQLQKSPNYSWSIVGLFPT